MSWILKSRQQRTRKAHYGRKAFTRLRIIGNKGNERALYYASINNGKFYEHSTI